MIVWAILDGGVRVQESFPLPVALKKALRTIEAQHEDVVTEWGLVAELGRGRA